MAKGTRRGQARAGRAVGLSLLLSLSLCGAGAGRAEQPKSPAGSPAATPASLAPAPAPAPGQGAAKAALSPVKPTVIAPTPPSGPKAPTSEPAVTPAASGKPGPAQKVAPPKGSDVTPTPVEGKGAEGKAAEGKGAGPALEGGAKSKSGARGPAKGAASRKDVVPSVAEGASPASPPPLTIANLRDEMHHEVPSGTMDPASPARSKVEQMLEEIAKTRASLHDDTARLEAMLTQDADGGAANPAGGAPGAPGAAKPPKNPLDVLAKALRAIKPEQAAPIVSRLDRRLAATVLQRMPPVDAGKILGAMKPDTAADLATQIAMRPVPLAEVKR